MLELLVDRALEDKKPKQSIPMLEVDGKKAVNDASRSTAALVSVSRAMDGSAARPSPGGAALTRVAGGRLVQSRYIPVRIKSHDLKQANYKCTYVDSISKRECTSTYALEFDHQRPLALGGTTTSDNIRVLCRAHNANAAIQAFGMSKMEKYLNRSD